MSAVYREVPVGEELPDENGIYFAIDESYKSKGLEKFTPFYSNTSYTFHMASIQKATHWLQCIEDAVVLTREDVEEIGSTLEAVRILLEHHGYEPNVQDINKALKLLEK